MHPIFERLKERKIVQWALAYLAGAWLGRGNILNESLKNEDALGAFDRALAIDSKLAEAWIGRGNALSELWRHDEALAA